MSFLTYGKQAFHTLRVDGAGALSRSIKRKLIWWLDKGNTWKRYSEEAAGHAAFFDFRPDDVTANLKTIHDNAGPLDIKRITWFIPDFHHPFYGGIYTILRFADYFQTQKGVQNQFALVGSFDTAIIKSKITAAFPSLNTAQVYRVNQEDRIRDLPESDAAIATLWNTAYFAMKYNATRRKFIFMQDYEALFFPAGSLSAQVETTYRFGFYGLMNTPALKDIYINQYGGKAESFLPCVDTRRFHPGEKPEKRADQPYKVFFYARPDTPRNGFELGISALKKLKDTLGDKVQIVSAGAQWYPSDYGLKPVIENLGLLTIDETAALYRECDLGLVMMFTRHPSYLPYELMASGCLVVTNYNPATTWFLKDDLNCLLSEASSSCLAERLLEGLTNQEKREQITGMALRDIVSHYSDWECQIEKIYQYMVNPDGIEPLLKK